MRDRVKRSVFRCLLMFLLINGFFVIPQASAVESGTIDVTASVLSKVSGVLSTVTTNLSEIPADGISSIMITVRVKFMDNTPASNKNVVISSNRGNVDIFSIYHGNNLVSGNQGQTDADGIVRFTAQSLAPGQATFTVEADLITLDNKPTVTFTPLPLLSNLSLSVKMPLIDKKIIILEPNKNKPNVTPGGKLVNTQTELQISFLALLILIVVLLSSPVLFIWLLVIYHRLKLLVLEGDRYREKEDDLLEKIFVLEQKLAENQQLELSKDKEIIEAVKGSEK